MDIDQDEQGKIGAAEEWLDCRGLNCPMPLLKTKQRLNQLAPGILLGVLTTDPGSVRDFNAFLGLSDHELIMQEEEEGEYRFVIRRG